MKLLVLPGDHIGPEITEAAMTVLQAFNEARGLGLEFEYDVVGFDSLAKYGATIRPELLAKIPDYGAVILGPQGNADYPPKEEGGINISAAFRVGLDMYANIRPARSRAELGLGAPGLDLVIVRELTEGFYADRNMTAGTGEFMPGPDIAMSMRKVTRGACDRICRRAFDLARTRRRKVTAIHKANVMKLTDGLFLEVFRNVAADYPDIEIEDILVDAAAALIIRTPERFDVIVTENMFGDILSDMASELSGSLGLAGSTMVGEDLCCAQAQHGSAPDIAGQDRANPSSLILSIGMMLEWLGTRHQRRDLADAGAAMSRAIDATLADPASRTADLGGSIGCAEFGARVASQAG